MSDYVQKWTYCRTVEQNNSGVKFMKCAYLFYKNSVRLCESMEEAGMDGKVSDFDVEHYCDGTPVNCFYFRNANKLKQPTFTIISKNL